MWSPWVRHGGDGVPVVPGTDVRLWFNDNTQCVMRVTDMKDDVWFFEDVPSGKRKVLYYQVWNHPLILTEHARKLLEVYK